MAVDRNIDPYHTDTFHIPQQKILMPELSAKADSFFHDTVYIQKRM